MNTLVVFTCSCHKGQVYLMNKGKFIKRLSLLGKSIPSELKGSRWTSTKGYPFKEIDDIQDLLINLTR